MRDRIGYLPFDLADALRHALTDGERAALAHGNGLWKLERMMEQAFATGYDQGWTRAYQAGHSDRRDVTPGNGVHDLLAVVRAAGGYVEVTPEQIAAPGRVSVNHLTSGAVEFVTHDEKPVGGSDA